MIEGHLLVSRLVSGSLVRVVVLRHESGKQEARPEGFEPPTLASEVRCSIH